MMNNDRGRGGTGPKKTVKPISAYGISPQLAPPVIPKSQLPCYNRSTDMKPGQK
jgi:hypothetical protein